GSVSGSQTFTGLTFDSIGNPGKNLPADVDWYQFALPSAPSAADQIKIVPLHDKQNLQLKLTLYSGGTALRTSGTNGILDLSGIGGGSYHLLAESVGAVTVDYQLQFLLASGADAAEPNNSAAAATSIPP